MEIIYRPAESTEELNAILDLQRINHFSVLSAKERALEGFVTLRHNLPLLLEMQSLCPQFIVMVNQTLAGYALCLHPDLAGLIPGLRPMFRELKALENPPKDFRVMGQICIASSFRRQGLFRGLYEHFKKNVAPLPVITEVARSNKRSLKAHSAIGFKTVAIHSEGGETWEVLCW